MRTLRTILKILSTRRYILIEIGDEGYTIDARDTTRNELQEAAALFFREAYLQNKKT